MLTLGCDPELVCHLNNRYTSASRYFKRDSSFGTDGDEAIAEVRPGFSVSPVDLCAKIRIILEACHDKYPDLQFYAGHYVNGHAIGGHIHFGGIEPSTNLITDLDTVLDSLSYCIDDLNQKASRRKDGYGALSSYKPKPHGFEYRTPGSWLVSPMVSLVTLTLAKLTYLGNHDYINFCSLRAAETPHDFLSSLHSNIKSIPDDCKPGLELVDDLLRTKINWETDIMTNWGIAA